LKGYPSSSSLISCLEDVRITEPFTFYPSEISLSVEPLGNVLNASDKIFADEVIKVVENNLDYSIHNQDKSCPWARFCSLSIVV
jgi:hypothetical protein